MDQVYVRVEALSKSYCQAGVDIHVLRAVSAEFMQGKTFAITGSSGSGKSTLLHIIAGFEIPDAGFVYIDGKNLFSLSAQERSLIAESCFGVVFQQPYLIKELSVVENIMLKGLVAGRDIHSCRAHAMSLLKTVGLEDKADVMPGTLSGGQQQRVAILRALFNKPAFLLADEPTGSLDMKTGVGVIEFLLECQKEWHMGLIVCSHDEYVVERMQHVLHLEHGKIVVK
jgi:ABC-type lipoprotein export system ATPase subunit